MAGPLSVDEILAKQKADKESAAKPKFLTKADRAKLALEKRNAEVKEQQEREEVERKERADFDRKAEEERRRGNEGRYGGPGGPGGPGGYGGDRYGGYERNGGYGGRNDGGRGGYGRDGSGGPGYGGQQGYGGAQAYGGQQGYGGAQGYGGQNGYNGPQRGGYDDRDGRYAGPSQSGPPNWPRGSNGPPTGPRSQHAGNGVASPAAAPSSLKPTTPGDVAMPTDSELSHIRARYLGQKESRTKPRLRKTADKRMIFEWKAEDDTSGETRFIVDQSIVPGRSVVPVAQDKVADAANEKYADALEKRRAGRGTNDDRHWSDKPLEEMKDRDWRIFREDFSISARGGSIPLPLRSWRESTIPTKILDVVDEVGYTEPSPIQRQAIPIGLQKRDLIGIAKTGSGKTAAFVIPMLDYISRLPPLNDDTRHLGPYALIMAPTRELAQQIEVETVKFASKLGFTTVSIVGGKDVEQQRFALRDGAEIIVATPGRLKDMIVNSMIVLSQTQFVILDEADRMVDLGFEIDLNIILDSMPSTLVKSDGAEAVDDPSSGPAISRVTHLFSATMPPAVQRLSMKYLHKPATVTIGTAGEVTDTVEQRVEFIHGDEKKKQRLQDILRNGGFPSPIIVFVNQKKTAEMVGKYVQQTGRSVITLHSDKNQEQREESLQSLRDGYSEVLVATDVAGRGIDIPDVSLVVNWQMSDTIEKYTHRSGRTGRAGKLGTVITFLSNDDEEVMFDLKKEIEKSKISKMNPELARHEAAKVKVTREMKRKRDEED